MQKLYEIFKSLKIQKRIVSAETIRGITVCTVLTKKLLYYLSYTASINIYNWSTDFTTTWLFVYSPIDKSRIP